MLFECNNSYYIILMKSLAILVANLMLIMTLALQTQAPTWTTNPNIDAGEVVAANYYDSSTYLYSNTTDKPLSKSYNRTTFTSVPRVILGVIGFTQNVPASSSTLFGYRVVITSIGLLSFNYNITVYGTLIYDLHFLCLAIQNEATTFYMAMVSQTFDSSTNLGNSTATQRWQTFTYANPGGWINSNYSNLDLQVIAFPTGYKTAAQSGRFHFSINGTAFNDSHYSVNVSTTGNNILAMLDFAILMFNKLPITANYSVYEDVAIYNVIGSTAYYFPPVVSALQYQYRNSLSGVTHVEFNISGETRIGFFYSTTTPADNFFVWRLFNNRVRSCPANLTYYDPATVLCQDQCLNSSSPNALNVCIACAYSCLTCSMGNSTTSCTSCSSAANRMFNNGSCPCNTGYYENGTSVCPPCDYRCLTCSAGTPTSCLTCNSTLLRAWSNATSECLCDSGLYQNTTCLSCNTFARGCIACTFNASNSNFTCSTCNATLNRLLSADNKTCICKDGYYQDSSFICQPCPLGCLSCSEILSQVVCSSYNSSLSRALSADNLSCICSAGLYENSSQSCVACQYGCLSCYLSGSTVLCTNCDSSTTRTMSPSNTSCDCPNGNYQHANKSCVPCINNCSTCTSDIVCTSCPLGYYLHTNHTCVVCSVGCLSCQLNVSSSQVCLNCSSNLNFMLQSASCVCIAGTTLTGSSCTNTTGTNTCGNGIMEANETCDDGNTMNSDGCSSLCLVETDHTCINNNSLSNVSLCYYTRKIQFQTKLIYKIPGRNSVQLKLYVNALNCNPSNLKTYLEKSAYLAMYDKTRLLKENERLLQGTSWTSIPTKSITFDSSTNVLTIVFDYDATIDLTKKYIQFVPSSSTNSQQIKYFYASPTSQLSLQQPYNNLSTTYYSQSDLSLVKNVQYFFLILIILYWIFLVITIVRKRGAIGTECMLVLQLTYLTLLDQTKLVESWSGFQLTGKYSFGVNPTLMSASAQKDLKALQIDANLVNVLNVSLALELLLFVAVIIYKLNQYYIKRKKRQEIMEMEQSQNRSVSNERPQQKLRIIDRVMTYVIDAFMSLMFLISGILVVAVFFTTSVNLVTNMIETGILVVTSTVFWIIYYQSKQSKAFVKVSYLVIVNNSSKTSLNSILKSIINNYYMLLYLTFIAICALISLMRKTGIAVFALIITACIVMIIFQLKYKVYFELLDTKRCIINCFALILLMLLHVVASLMSTSLGTGFSIVLVSFIILLVVLIINVFIFIVVTRKQRKREVQEQIHNEQMKQMDNELANANISFIGAHGYNSMNKSRDFTKDKDFMNSLQYSSARKILLENGKGEEQLKMIEQKIRELKDFKKNIIQGIDLSRSQLNDSEGNNITLENVLGALDLTNQNEIEAI